MNRITRTAAAAVQGIADVVGADSMESEERLRDPKRSSLGGMMLAAFGILLVSLIVRALFG